MARQKKDVIDWKTLDDSDPEKYNLYMKSEDWAEVRQMVLERDHHRCRFCARNSDQEQLQIHHSKYQGILFHETEGDNLDYLITCCRICHKNCHSAPSNRQRFRRPKN